MPAPIIYPLVLILALTFLDEFPLDAEATEPPRERLPHLRASAHQQSFCALREGNHDVG